MASLLSACSFSLAEDITPPPGSEQMPPVAMTQPAPLSGALYPLVPPNPESGKSIFVEKCVPCHGNRGLGDGPQAAQLPNPVAAIGSVEVARQSTPARWYTQVTQGNLEKFMPPFSSLSDRQRWDVVAYAFSLTTPATTLEQGKELFQANCAHCHGKTGKGDGPDAAGLSKPPVDLTDQAFMAQKSAADFFQAISQGTPPAMPAFGDQLAEVERWALAAYLRSLTFIAPEGSVAEAGTSSPGGTPAAAGEGTSIPATPLANAPVQGTVTGKVTSTAGIDLKDNVTVTLHAFDNMQEVMTQTTTLQADGSYLFSDVQMPPGRVFMTTIEYQQASYGSDIGTVQDGVDTIDLPITVYETTTDASILKADRLHLFFEFVDTKTVRVIELYIISNPTDKTLVPAEAGSPTVKFSLPQGATNLEFQDGALGGRYMQTADGFGDTASIRPGSGSYEMLFSYQMPYNRKLDLERPISMPIDAVVILVPEGEIKIKSDQLQDGGTRDVQGTQYHTYSGSSLAAGDKLKLTLTGRPAGGAPGLAAGSNTSLLVGLSVFGAALVLAGVWLYLRTRSGETVLKVERAPLSTMAGDVGADSAESLMDAIIALDDLYQAGKLPEEAYQERRDELKGRLKEILGERG